MVSPGVMTAGPFGTGWCAGAVALTGTADRCTDSVRGVVVWGPVGFVRNLLRACHVKRKENVGHTRGVCVAHHTSFTSHKSAPFQNTHAKFLSSAPLRLLSASLR